MVAMDYSDEISDSDDAVQIFNVKDIPSLLFFEEVLDEQTEAANMTSLSALLLLSESKSKTGFDDCEDDVNAKCRLSLAYERLHSMPKILLEELAPHIKILDISNNEFDKLDFLSQFKELTTLICDHNNINSTVEIPYMPKLELLWMNHCKIKDLYPWANGLQQSCPNLKYLSLMGNPAAPSYLNGGNFYDYLQYRLFIISLFPKLVHLDDRTVTDDQRKQALCLYKRPLFERIIPKSTNGNLPLCLRSVKNKMTTLLSPAPGFVQTTQRNIIV